jgi:hypothetical protein
MTKHTALPTLLLIALALFGGCRTISYDPSGNYYAVFQLGDYKMLLNTTAPVAFQAVQKAVQQSDLFQTSAVLNKYDGVVMARTRADQKVRIKIEETNSRQTMINIRWGEGGDLPYSRKLFDAIEANVGK